MNLKQILLRYLIIGSKSSSTEDFLKLVEPSIAIIGVGENNKFGHPNAEVLDRLKKYEMTIFRTDNNGEISINISANSKVKVRTFENNVKL